jgi:hypothetical protein
MRIKKQLSNVSCYLPWLWDVHKKGGMGLQKQEKYANFTFNPFPGKC